MWKKVEIMDRRVNEIAALLNAEIVENVPLPEYGLGSAAAIDWLRQIVDPIPHGTLCPMVYYIECDALWGRYKGHCALQGQPICSKAEFVGSLQQIAPNLDIVESNRKHWFRGVRLKR